MTNLCFYISLPLENFKTPGGTWEGRSHSLAMILRLETCKDKYSLRKSIFEHPFGTLKRNMNFTYLLLRNLKNVRGEISIAFFTYNLKRVIKILGVKGILESLYTVILLTIFNNVNLYRKVYA